MPDGSLTVIQEPDRVRNSFVGSEVDIVDIKQGGTAEVQRFCPSSGAKALKFF